MEYREREISKYRSFSTFAWVCEPVIEIYFVLYTWCTFSVWLYHFEGVLKSLGEGKFKQFEINHPPRISTPPSPPRADALVCFFWFFTYSTYLCIYINLKQGGHLHFSIVSLKPGREVSTVGWEISEFLFFVFCFFFSLGLPSRDKV